VAILEHNPVSSHGSTFNILFGSVSHTLTKGEELEFVLAEANNINQLLNIIEGVGTWAENEDNWSLLS
jgi:hypothetical protein